MLLLGHRGYSDQYSENTMLAFSKAIESGFDGIETDVHKTKDGVLVLCHDEKINRTSDGKGYIKDMTYEELCAYNFGTKENPQRIPLLKELLELCKGKNVKINLEIKTNKRIICIWENKDNTQIQDSTHTHDIQQVIDHILFKYMIDIFKNRKTTKNTHYKI